jgi:hypothetical protein
MAQPPQHSSGMPQAPFVDTQTGDIAVVWRQFLVSLYNRTGGAAGGNINDPTVARGLAAEIVVRQQGDAALNAQIEAEIARAEAAETGLGQSVAAEANARANADYALSAAIAQEAADRQAADALLVPLAQLCVLWSQCNLLFLPTSNPGFGLPWQQDGFVVLGLPPPAPAMGVEAGVDQWISESGTDQWVWG